MNTRKCPHCANDATAKKVLIDSFVGPYEMWHVTCNSVFCNKKSDLFKTKEAAEADWDAKFPIKDLYNKESYRFQLKDSEKQWLENRKDVCFRCGRDKKTECIYSFCYYAQCVGQNYPMNPKRYTLSGFSQDVAEFEAMAAIWLAKEATPGPWTKSEQGTNETYHHRIERYYGGKEVPEHIAYIVLPNVFGNSNDAAYIVAACNAVPRLVEMVKYLSEESRVETNGANTWRVRESKTVLQEAYEATDPKRKTAAEDHSNTLTWTNEIPNVPGFYWMRSSLFPEPHIMNFSIEVIPLCADDLLPGIEFAGPIPEPTRA